jgi:hypothetical protein
VQNTSSDDDATMTFQTIGGGTLANRLTIDESGNSTFTGSVTAASANIGGKLSLTANGAFVSNGSTQFYRTATNGLNIVPTTGSVNDFELHNGSGQGVFSIPTGTQNATFAGNVGIGVTADTSVRTFIKGSDSGTNNFQILTRNSSDANILAVRNDGNIGVGTTLPNQEGFGAGNRILSVKAPTSGGVGSIELIGLGNAQGDEVGYVNFMSQAATASLASIVALRHTSDETGDLAFRTSGTERMRLTSGGNIDINSHTGATIGYGVRIAKGSGYSQLYMEADTTSTRIIQRFYNPTGNVGNISIVAYNTTYSTSSSDERLKKNITNWDENILDKFKDIKPKEFHFHNQDDSEEKIKGYIAQNEVDKFPEAYPLLYNEEVGEDRHMFNPSGMVVYLMKAIQELKAEVDLLKSSCNCK